jgi:hypothetical protein
VDAAFCKREGTCAMNSGLGRPIVSARRVAKLAHPEASAGEAVRVG